MTAWTHADVERILLALPRMEGAERTEDTEDETWSPPGSPFLWMRPKGWPSEWELQVDTEFYTRPFPEVSMELRRVDEGLGAYVVLQVPDRCHDDGLSRLMEEALAALDAIVERRARAEVQA